MESYKRPPYDLLKMYWPVDCSQEELQATAETLEKLVSQFLKTQVGVTQIILGPHVTRYELEVPRSASLKSLHMRCADIAKELAVDGGVRIEAPIPGKSAVGIEVPKGNKSVVGLRELVSSQVFANNKSPLLFSVGMDVGGEPVVCDLEKIPHLLIAGQTGGEISVGLNSLIVSLLYKSGPEDLRFILVDPNRTEFSKFRGMPHLLFEKIVTKPIEALNVLEWAKEEMNRRYTLLQKYECCKIAEYNSMPDVLSGKLHKLPHVVIVIDELANLMQSLLSRKIESNISTIVALARATGIHLIVATRHPSADVITGYLKANFTSRIAYKVLDEMSSRIIIDMTGAEALTGDGDMLFFPQDAFVPKRVQGSFVGDDEVELVVDYLKEKYECDFDKEAEKFVSGGDGDPDGIEADPILPQVIAYVIKKEQISAAIIQRRFAIGYARVARIIDYMEEQGFIGPVEAKTPRRIIITREAFMEIYGKDVDDV
ncbi:MAG: hypothetical protein K2O39_02405 [Clostridiales bacterium]|nr:hypothetical protein [Clostridiales bacterium]